MSKPTIGRIVHFVLKDGETIRPAQITTVHSDVEVNLVVTLEPGDEAHESSFHGRAVFSITGQPHTWRWPDRA